MSNNSGPESKSLAERICDGEPIDWPQPAESTTPHLHSTLQLLDTIARTCRAPSRAAAEDSALAAWGTLQLREVLGVGSYGSVHRAFDPLLRREVALKLSRTTGSKAREWLGEARRLSRVRHPNVVAIHGAEFHDGRAGIWFELIEGQDLQTRVERHGALGAEETIAVGQSVCAAMAAVHAAGLIHGDIKPTNILRENGGRIVLLDFGSARDSGSDSLLTGSPAYLAPELLEGGAPSVASDVFALGKSLRNLLAAPLSGVDDSAKSLLDLRPDLPQALVDCIESACSADPSRRPRSAGAFSARLAMAGAISKPHRSTRPLRRVLAWTLAAAIALLAVSPTDWRGLANPPALLASVALMTRDAEGVAQPVRAPLQIGSPLSLQLTPSREVFIYVINQDDRGNRNLLYPLTADHRPIPAHEHVELPGLVDGQRVDWQVDSSSSQERFAILASTRRLSGLEQSLANWPRAGQPLPASDQPLRGVGGLTRQPAGPQLDLDAVVSPYRGREDVEVVVLGLRAG